MSQIKEHTYAVSGMHCASCEILIEKKLLELPGVKSVEASNAKGKVLIEYEGKLLGADELNKIFKRENYIFSDKPSEVKNDFKKNDFLVIFGISLLLIFGFIFLNKLGLSRFVNINSNSSLPMFFIFGVLAGISSCAALVGGLVLSMSKQWAQFYSEGNSNVKNSQPHIMFNAGRLISYAFFGAILGAIGSRLQISLQFSSILVIAISIMMIVLALQMLGFRAFRRFQFTLPRFIHRYVADENNFKGRYMPFLMGAFTFFLPCGFTITAQGLALISGSLIQGGLIMLLFALGTLPTLLVIGFSSIKFFKKPDFSNRFLKVAGVLVLFFAFFNINNQFNILGLPSFNNLSSSSIQSPNVDQSSQIKEDDLPQITDGKQVLKMNASASGYTPNYFKVRAGVPVRWEITDTGTSGCTNAIISRSLFNGEITLTPGQVSVKEFTPAKAGKYKFSCWMGMVTGTIEVVDKNSSQTQSNTSFIGDNNSLIPSGVSGCGTGGGCGCGCGK